jgi:hypothetical protein
MSVPLYDRCYRGLLSFDIGGALVVLHTLLPWMVPTTSTVPIDARLIVAYEIAMDAACVRHDAPCRTSRTIASPSLRSVSGHSSVCVVAISLAYFSGDSNDLAVRHPNPRAFHKWNHWPDDDDDDRGDTVRVVTASVDEMQARVDVVIPKRLHGIPTVIEAFDHVSGYLLDQPTNAFDRIPAFSADGFFLVEDAHVCRDRAVATSCVEILLNVLQAPLDQVRVVTTNQQRAQCDASQEHSQRCTLKHRSKRLPVVEEACAGGTDMGGCRR